MAGRKSFAELRARMSPEAQDRVATKAEALDAAMDLAAPRRAMRLSQEEIAAVLQVGQGSVARMEKRADLLLGTLRRFVQAMGGELDLVARFPDRSVRIETLASLSDARQGVEEPEPGAP